VLGLVPILEDDAAGRGNEDSRCQRIAGTQ
jgi:hypothetical protein